MIQPLKALISRLITHTPIQYFPVTIQRGLAKGAHWTLFPYSAYWRGNTELDVEAAIRLHGSISGLTCWDLGTHFGIYTVGMAMAVETEGQVIGFEPDPVSFKRCQRHVQMNALSQVKLFNAAVSNVEGTADLLLSQGAGASTSHLAYEDEQPNDKLDREVIQTVILDELVKAGKIRPAQFIKVDVEGHGAKALSGAQQTISASRPTIVMSFHSKWELEGTKEVLEPLGYRSFNVDGQELEWSASLYRTTILRC
jgi:FkbM family methyltransferase